MWGRGGARPEHQPPFSLDSTHLHSPRPEAGPGCRCRSHSCPGGACGRRARRRERRQRLPPLPSAIGGTPPFPSQGAAPNSICRRGERGSECRPSGGAGHQGHGQIYAVQAEKREGRSFFFCPRWGVGEHASALLRLPSTFSSLPTPAFEAHTRAPATHTHRLCTPSPPSHTQPPAMSLAFDEYGRPFIIIRVRVGERERVPSRGARWERGGKKKKTARPLTLPPRPATFPASHRAPSPWAVRGHTGLHAHDAPPAEKAPLPDDTHTRAPPPHQPHSLSPRRSKTPSPASPAWTPSRPTSRPARPSPGSCARRWGPRAWTR